MTRKAPRLPRARHYLRDQEAWPRDLLALYSAPTMDAFIAQAFRIVPRVVRCNYVSVFYRRAGDGFLKERDSRGRVWGRAFMRRYAELTPAIPLVMANPGIKLIATRTALTDSDATLQQTAFYREVMQKQGWRHGAVLCFWDGLQASFPMLVLSAYRGASEPDFSDQDLAALAELHPFLVPAVSRFHQISAAHAVSDGLAKVLRHLPRGLVVLDGRLRVVRSNLAGRRSCALWGRPRGTHVRLAAESTHVPSDLLQACQRLLRELVAMMRQHPDADAQRRLEITHADLPDFSASIAVMCRATAVAEPTFVIEFQSGERPVADGMTPALLDTLTASEREVALVVSEGLSNAEAAERLGKTVHAVKFLLHRIYDKLQVPNRARLALLVGQGQSK